MRETSGQTAVKQRTGRGWIIVLALIIWLSLTAAALLFFDARTVRFYLYGGEEMNVEYGSAFTDPGVYAVTAGRIFGESEKRLDIQSEGTVDTSRLGTYVLTYSTNFAFNEYCTQRVVNVVDTTPPVIELKHIEGYQPTWMTGYAEEGYTAHDNVDGDLTGHVERLKLDDRVLYTVTDSSGNSTSVERLLPALSYRPPRITLLGGDNMVLQAGTWFEDPGVTVSDDLGSDLSDHLVTEGVVIPWFAGDYQISYSITSELGETISAVRNVQVVPVGLPQTVTPEEKTIYLTFDDGPGPYTARLLDVLDKYGAKATFFVTAQDSRYLDQIGRAFKAGHSIGVHTSSHDYNKIYASEYAFFEDFFNMEEIIKQQTGEYTRLFRFPGGSSNTVSNFNPGIMSRLTRAMNDMGYQYFDWNVTSGDAGGTTKTDQVIQNIKDGCKQHRISVVLQHDIKDYSVAAVESILNWGKENGYSFKALQLDSPGTHHGVNN
ncbi:MAG: polysaccharide deacetylase [Oscillospiraceae bacterium]|nr:polysaccharide deacetylase [Oscillospiraceae bacterium]